MFNYGSGRIYFDKRDGWQYVLSSCTFLRSLLLLMQVSIELEKSHSWFSRFKQIQPYFDPKSSMTYILFALQCPFSLLCYPHCENHDREACRVSSIPHDIPRKNVERRIKLDELSIFEGLHFPACASSSPIRVPWASTKGENIYSISTLAQSSCSPLKINETGLEAPSIFNRAPFFACTRCSRFETTSQRIRTISLENVVIFAGFRAPI